MGVRRQAREAAVQVLYMCDFLQQWDPELVKFAYSHFGITDAVRPYSETLAQGVITNLAEIDSQITCASEHWSIGRMGRVDRAIIRSACFELLFLPDVPKNVAINEAIEIAKRYGADESPNFVNGVLDRLGSLRNNAKILQRFKAVAA